MRGYKHTEIKFLNIIEVIINNIIMITWKNLESIIEIIAQIIKIK